VNGRFVGTLPELAEMTPEMGALPFSSSLMSRHIQPGKNRVELWVADWTTDKPLLTRVGKPDSH
jgi:hypothetical protein